MTFLLREIHWLLCYLHVAIVVGAGDEDSLRSRTAAAWHRGGAVARGSGLPVSSGTLSVGRWASGDDSLGVCASAAPPLYGAGATGPHNTVGLGSPD